MIRNWYYPSLTPITADKTDMDTVKNLMSNDVACINMDTFIGDAIQVCSDRRIRHLPVIDDQNQLVGLVTDRDLRYFTSPRIGSISENNSDRESLKRPVHLIMVRNVTTASPEIPLSEAAERMLAHRVGCLPVVDTERHVIGIITNSDLLRYIAQGM